MRFIQGLVIAIEKLCEQFQQVSSIVKKIYMFIHTSYSQDYNL